MARRPRHSGRDADRDFPSESDWNRWNVCGWAWIAAGWAGSESTATPRACESDLERGAAMETSQVWYWVACELSRQDRSRSVVK